MDSLLEKVITALRKHYGDSLVVDGLETSPSTGRVMGWIAAAAFQGLDDPERRESLYRTLQSELTSTEYASIGPIVALTPVEAQFDLSPDLPASL